MNNSNPKAFVCGWPIHHSRSPLIHTHWLKTFGINGAYEKVAIEPDQLADFVRNMQTEGYVGGNFTIPHKEALFDLVDEIDGAAKKIGAINTLWIEGKKLIGGNSDWLGFAANLDQLAPDWSSSENRKKTVTVLGAGGAARGILFALLDRGFEKIVLANRTLEKAIGLRTEFGARIHPIQLAQLPDAANETHLVINTTSLGMSGDKPIPGEIKEFLKNLPSTAIVNDIVYTPLETELLSIAKAEGLQTVDGLGMLLHQAAPGFEKWFGQKPEVTPALRQLILDDIESATS